LARLPRTNLLCFHATNGQVVAVSTTADWLKRRAEIVQGMEAIMGPFPGAAKRCPLDLKIEEETNSTAFIRRRLTYSSEPGSRVPAFLLIPKSVLSNGTQAPAVLALHPTDMEYGYRVVVEPLRESYRAYASDLASRGFVVLAPAYPIMANYSPPVKELGYKSGTMKAIWDNMRGLDLLESLPYVKKGKFGAIGHSLGGHNAIYTSVFDERIQAVVSSCGFDSFVDYKGGNITGWTSERYMPGLLQFKDRLADIPFDFHELIGALAPRPVFINAPQRDSNFNAASVDGVVRAASAVYRLYGAGEQLRLEHPDCGHDFPPDIREKAYRFLEQSLE
jgi:dienelactone hydrolase